MTRDSDDSEHVPFVRSVHNLFTILFNLYGLKSNQLFISAFHSTYLIILYSNIFHLCLFDLCTAAQNTIMAQNKGHLNYIY